MGRLDHFEPEPYVSRVRGCSDPGCMKTTREGKPFCPDHVELHPYVQGVVAMRDLRETDLKELAKGQKVAESSLLFQEILIHITNHGPKTVER